MWKPTRNPFGNLIAVIALCLVVTVSSVLPAQTKSIKPSTSGAHPKQLFNRVHSDYVITPKEATEWHELKAKGGPALSGNESWKSYMTFVERELKEYGQEDGPFGFLAIAKYFSNIPQSERPRTLMFFMDNRHFMPGGECAFAAQDWLAKNPNYKDKVVAVIGREHLGQIEYVEDGDKIEPSGRTDPHNLYVTSNDTMVAPAQNPGTPPPASSSATGTPLGVAAGFQQLAKDRLASDFIQDRYYRFKEAGDLWTSYSIFAPRNYDQSKKWPLIVMLHGLNITPVQQIRFEGVAELAEKYGYLVVCPMGYSVRSFWGMPNIGRGLVEGEPGFENENNLKLNVQELAYQDTMNVFNLVRKEFNIDENRIFLTGHSMGGAGAYFYAAKHPEIWAGVAPIAGGGINDRYAPGEKVKNLSFLVLQGEKDLIVRAEASRASVAKMKELGIQHTYVEVPGADHEVWIRHNPANMAKVFEFFNGLSKEARK